MNITDEWTTERRDGTRVWYHYEIAGLTTDDLATLGRAVVEVNPLDSDDTERRGPALELILNEPALSPRGSP